MSTIRSLSARARLLPLSIKMLIITLALLLALVPLLLGGYFSLETTRQRLFEDKRSDLRANSEEVANSIDRIMKVREAEIATLANDPGLALFAIDNETDPQAAATILSSYRTLLSMRADLRSLRLISAKTGRILLSTSGGEGQFLGNRPFIKAAVLGRTYASPPSRDGGEDLVYYSSPVKDNAGNVIAVAVMAVAADDIWQELHKEFGQMGKGWSVVLTDEYGVRIGHSSGHSLTYKSWVPLPEGTGQMLVDEKHYGADITEIDSTDMPVVAGVINEPELPANILDFNLSSSGERYEAGLARTDLNPWVVVEMLPQSAFLGDSDSMRKWMVVTIGFTAALIMLLTFFINRMALKPINQLVNSVQNMTEGDLTTPVPDIADREMSVLADRFDTLRMRVHDSFSELQRGYIDLAKALVASLEARDPYTAGHTERVAQYSLPLARKLGLSDTEVETIKRAAELHDIGKVGVPDSVLLKTDRLTPSEAIEIKRHPIKGGEIVRYLGFLREVIPSIENHHERYDGKGYPHGTKGEDIPLGARILAVADAYDAMTSTRAYRNAMNHDQAAEILEQGSGTQWDPIVVRAFIDVLKEQHHLDEQSGLHWASSSL
jgi:putative nucleotidyltransferase with HDIG domain